MTSYSAKTHTNTSLKNPQPITPSLVVDGVTGFHIERDGLASQRLHKDLHAATQAQHQVQRALLLDIVIRERAAIFKLLAGKDQALLVGRDAFLVLNLCLDLGCRRLRI